MKVKVIRVGNSAAVTIPKIVLKEKNIEIGDEVEIEVKSLENKTAITKELLEWINQYIEKNHAALEELADRIKGF